MNTPNYIHRYNESLRRAFLLRCKGRTSDGRELSTIKVNGRGELVR